MKKYLLLTFLSLYGVAANAVENTITVLGVVHPSANSVRATELLQRVAISWPTSTGTTITLANGGGLVSLTFATSGTDNDQRTAAMRGGPVFLDSFRGRDKWSPAV